MSNPVLAADRHSRRPEGYVHVLSREFMWTGGRLPQLHWRNLRRYRRRSRGPLGKVKRLCRSSLACILSYDWVFREIGRIFIHVIVGRELKDFSEKSSVTC